MIQKSFDDHNSGSGHDLHDLIKADTIMLQTKIGQGDKAHGPRGELCYITNGEALDFKDAESCRNEKKKKCGDEMKACESGSKLETVNIHGDFVHNDEKSGGEKVEKHATDSAEVDIGEVVSEIGNHGERIKGMRGVCGCGDGRGVGGGGGFYGRRGRGDGSGSGGGDRGWRGIRRGCHDVMTARVEGCDSRVWSRGICARDDKVIQRVTGNGRLWAAVGIELRQENW